MTTCLFADYYLLSWKLPSSLQTKRIAKSNFLTHNCEVLWSLFFSFTSLLYLRSPLSHTRSSYLVCAATQHKVKIGASNKRSCALVRSVKQKGLSHVIFPHSPVHSALCVSWRSCRYGAYCSWEAWVMKNKQPSWSGSSKFVHFLGFFFSPALLPPLCLCYVITGS